jgi:hypothetical protein
LILQENELKMKKVNLTNIGRRNLLIFASFVVCGLTCLLFWQWFVVGCMWWECVESGYFESQEIQIPREYFPNGSAYSNLGVDRNTYGAKQHQAQNIFWGEYHNSSAILHIYRYPGIARAKKGFATEVRINGELFDIPSKQSDGLKYQSNSANQLFIGCGEKITPWGHKCVFVARYGEDIISLNMTIDEQMTLKDFEYIISYLDTVSAERLGH